MGIISILPGADFSGGGLPNVLAPLPRLGGTLFACYLPGIGWNGAGAVGRDYSGQRGDLVLNSAVVDADGVFGRELDYATTPFSGAALAAGTGAFTWVAAITVPTASLIFPALSSGPTLPYAAMHFSTGSNAIQGFKVDSGGNDFDAYVYDPTKIEGALRFAHCRWDSAGLKVGIVDPAAGWTGAAGYKSLATTKSIAGAGLIRVLPLPSGAPSIKASLLGFYTGSRTDAEMAEVYASAKKLLARKGLVI